MMLAVNFRRWYALADYNAPYAYYRGHLALDRGPDSKDAKSPQQTEVHLLAEAVWDLHEQGLLSLAQQKVAPGVFVYYATKLKGLDGRRSKRAFARL